MSSNRHTTIFVHISKTAGSTLHSIIEKQYPPENLVHLKGKPYIRDTIETFIHAPDEEKTNIRLLTGHIHYGIHAYLPQNATYFSLLRNPTDRIVSDYYYILRTPTHPRYNIMTQNKMSIKDYIDAGFVTANAQTKILAGMMFQNETDCTQKTLDTAIQNIEKDFAVVGLTERFDETLLLFKNAFGWDNISYVKRNVTKNRPKVSELNSVDLEALNRLNEFDNQLYDYVKRRFNQQIRAMGLEFKMQYGRFKFQQVAPPLIAEIRKHSVREFIKQKYRAITNGSSK
jgi:hypothetical protein